MAVRCSIVRLDARARAPAEPLRTRPDFGCKSSDDLAGGDSSDHDGRADGIGRPALAPRTCRHSGIPVYDAIIR